MLNEDGIDLKGKKGGMTFKLGQYRLRLWGTGYEFCTKAGCYSTTIERPKFVKDHNSMDPYHKKRLWREVRKWIFVILVFAAFSTLFVEAVRIVAHAIKHSTEVQQSEQAKKVK